MLSGGGVIAAGSKGQCAQPLAGVVITNNFLGTGYESNLYLHVFTANSAHRVRRLKACSLLVLRRMIPSAPSSLQSALQMDPNAHLQMQQQQSQAQQPQGQVQVQPPQEQSQGSPQQSGNNQGGGGSGGSSAKRRRKNEGGHDEGQGPSEPRRLRRSHEACARCRGKKIKASPDGRHRRQLPLRSLTIILSFSFPYFIR